MTPWAQAKDNTERPGYGTRAAPTETIRFRNAIPQNSAHYVFPTAIRICEASA